MEQREAEAKDKAQRLLTRARHETGVNSPEENSELMQVCVEYETSAVMEI